MVANLKSAHPLIRNLTLSDVDRIVEIEHTAYPYPWTRGIFGDCIRAGYDCSGLQLGPTLIAYAIQNHVAGESHLLNLCVHPDWQCHGFGSLLLEHAIRLARRQNNRCMFLEVRPSNPAGIGLYLKRGFSVIGERTDYYRTDDGRENAYVMRLEFNDRISGENQTIPQGNPF